MKHEPDELREHASTPWRTWWVGLVGLGFLVLDAALVLSGLVAVVLTAAVTPRVDTPVTSRIPTVVEMLPGRAVVLGWAVALLLVGVRQCLLVPSLRRVRRPGDVESRPVVSTAIRIWIAFVVFALSWVGLLVARESLLPSVTLPTGLTNCRSVYESLTRHEICDQVWTIAGRTFHQDFERVWWPDPTSITVLVADPGHEVAPGALSVGVLWAAVALLVVALTAPDVFGYRAPVSAFHGTDPFPVKVGAAEVWLAAHGLLPSAWGAWISRRWFATW